MRVFVAIDMPETALDALESVQDQVPVGRLMLPETLHLTLAFLGEQPDSVLIEVDEALKQVQVPKFDLQLHGLGTFGARSPSVLWAGTVPNPALSTLRDRARGAVRLTGLELPRERFRPHVTLARYGARLHPDELERLRMFLSRFGDVDLPAFSVDQFTMFQSLRTSGGAVHQALADYPLI